MLVGDLLEGVALALAVAGLYFIVEAVSNPIIGMGGALVAAGAALGYLANVHGGVPVRTDSGESS